MTTRLIDGQRHWSLEQTREGHRIYTIRHLVEAATTDGPFNVMNTSGLPLIGSIWNFDNDLDIWAFCQPDMRVTVHQEKEGDPSTFWTVEQKFSTIGMTRCNDVNIEDPLLEPQKISGSFVRYTKEATKDKDGDSIKSTSYEIIHGPAVEFDNNRPNVRIEQNVLTLGLATFASMVDTVNSSSLWGLSARTIKLSNVTWERKIYGVCGYYYTRAFEFDIDYNTWDRDIQDEGTKVLNGKWNSSTGAWDLVNVGGSAPSATNPAHYMQFTDRAGNPTRIVFSSANPGRPATSESDIRTFEVQYYTESNFRTLGIPTTF